MKTLLATIILATVAVPSLASEANLLRSAHEFGIKGKYNIEGEDYQGRKCSFNLSVEPTSFSAYGSVFITANSVSNASFHPYSATTITKIASDGDAIDGVFLVESKETVEAHKTDFGLHIPTYKVEHKVKVTFERGTLVSASISTGRIGPSATIFDPDFSSGKVEKCADK
jgi:hypothetical protein